MRFIATLLMISLGLASCHKKDVAPVMPAADEAIYQVQVKLNWAAPSFTVPVGAHFSNFVGLVHSVDTFMWAPLKYASTGLEYIAEVGSNWRMENELDSMISLGKGLQKFNLPPAAITGTIDTIFNFTQKFSAISVASMIAPSPDWFVGISNLNLLADGQWIKEMAVPLYAYDAGTEEGDIFSYNNPESNPRQLIQLLTPANASVLANGNLKMAAVGTVRFIKR